MAKPINCDLCGEEEAVLMQTSLADGSSLAVGPACLFVFFAGGALGIIESGPHTGAGTKCQACRRVHERMTLAAQPPAVPEDDQNDHTSEPADSEAAGTAP